MTAQDFLAFYPQFDSVFPTVVLSAYIAQANARFDQFGDDAEEARRLFVAHKLTMYARSFPMPDEDSNEESEGDSEDDSATESEDNSSDDSNADSSADNSSADSSDNPGNIISNNSSSKTSSWSYSRLASSGDGARVTGKRVENVQISYSSGSSSSSAYSSAAFADLAETVYGQQLLSLLKLYSFPRYVP